MAQIYWASDYWATDYWATDYWPAAGTADRIGSISTTLANLTTAAAPPNFGYWAPDYWATDYWATGYWGAPGNGWRATFTQPNANIGYISSTLDDLATNINVSSIRVEVFDVDVVWSFVGQETQFQVLTATIGSTLDGVTSSILGSVGSSLSLGTIGTTLDDLATAISGTFIVAPARTGSFGTALADCTAAFTGIVSAHSSSVGGIATLLDNATALFQGTSALPTYTATIASTLDDVTHLIEGNAYDPGTSLFHIDTTLEDVVSVFIGTVDNSAIGEDAVWTEVPASTGIWTEVTASGAVNIWTAA